MLNIRICGRAVNRAQADRPTPLELVPRHHCHNAPALYIRFPERSTQPSPAPNCTSALRAHMGPVNKNIHVMVLVDLIFRSAPYNDKQAKELRLGA
jgi:hypothetical protein